MSLSSHYLLITHCFTQVLILSTKDPHKTLKEIVCLYSLQPAKGKEKKKVKMQRN